MVYDREREKRNDTVYAEHKRAIAAGEKRILRKTSTGELHSYPADEIGFSPGRGQAQVSTWWGMGILMVFSASVFVTCLWLFLRPSGMGAHPSGVRCGPLASPGSLRPTPTSLPGTSTEPPDCASCATLLSPGQGTWTSVFLN
ncbi:hypothetical protein J2808_002387 [Pseudarthrobacter sulfonivorans]|nr:hypothetical protein [Pseudarthrobacter sulfonivorans]